MTAGHSTIGTVNGCKNCFRPRISVCPPSSVLSAAAVRSPVTLCLSHALSQRLCVKRLCVFLGTGGLWDSLFSGTLNLMGGGFQRVTIAEASSLTLTLTHSLAWTATLCRRLHIFLTMLCEPAVLDQTQSQSHGGQFLI